MTVLFLYSLLPILTNTYTGIKGVSPALVEAGMGMGMSPRQLLFMVKLPLAFPVIIAGIRIASVYIVSWATLAAFVGGGGLGDPILTGIMTRISASFLWVRFRCFAGAYCRLDSGNCRAASQRSKRIEEPERKKRR